MSAIRPSKTLVLTAALLAGLTGQSAAQVYDNGPPDLTNGNEMTQWIQAEDFSLLSLFNITGVRFWALELEAGAFGGTGFWQFYADDGFGNPGALIAGGDFTPTVFAAAGPCPWLACYQVEFSLGGGLVLGPGSYWLGLHNGPLSTTDRREFYWATTGSNLTNTGHEDIAPFGTGGWFDNGQEHAFQLFADATTVPEPGTVALLATGLVGMAGAGWIRRRRQAERA